MAITEHFAGSESITTTEWSLTTDTAGPDVDTTDGVFQCFLDLNLLAKGDKFTFRVYEKVGAATTQRVVFRAFLSHAQSEPIFVTPALVLMHGWDCTLVKTAGTDRVIDFSIRKVA